MYKVDTLLLCMYWKRLEVINRDGRYFVLFWYWGLGLPVVSEVNPPRLLVY